MQKIYTLLICFMVLSVVSCNEDDKSINRAAKNIEVTIGSAPNIGIAEADTRTSLGEDGVSIVWNTNDVIALWAESESGSMAFEATPFQMYHYNAEWNTARFTGNIAQMSEGQYTYYATYPTPKSYNGTKATFAIAATQNGEFNPAHNVMVAQGVATSELTAGDNSDIVALQFRQMVHIMRIRIPSNGMNQKISELQIEFPSAVAGDMAIDITDPASQPTIESAASNTITLKFATPKDVGDVVYAMFAPINMAADEEVQITAVGQTGYSKPGIIPSKNFMAGHTTPVALNIPELGREFTSVLFSLNGTGTATLGQAVTSYTLTAPAGVLFDNGSNVKQFEVKAGVENKIYLRDNYSALSGKTINVSYNSKDATVANSFTMPTIVADRVNVVPALNIPYLLEERFGTITTFSNNDRKTGIVHPDAIWIPGLSGWSAARVAGSAGKAVRLTGHIEGGFGAGVAYESRMDSPAMSRLKSGSKVTLKVTFNYSASFSGSGTLSKDKQGNPTMQCGFTTTTGGIKGDVELGDNKVGNTITITSRGGSYNSIGSSHSYNIANASNATRLSWYISGNGEVALQGWPWEIRQWWYDVYIDNVTVSIK